MIRIKRRNQIENTITVKELIALLAAYPESAPVFAVWEGQEICIDSDCASLQMAKKGGKEFNAVFLDVNDY